MRVENEIYLEFIDIIKEMEINNYGDNVFDKNQELFIINNKSNNIENQNNTKNSKNYPCNNNISDSNFNKNNNIEDDNNIENLNILNNNKEINTSSVIKPNNNNQICLTCIETKEKIIRLNCNCVYCEHCYLKTLETQIDDYKVPKCCEKFDLSYPLSILNYDYKIKLINILDQNKEFNFTICKNVSCNQIISLED